MDFQVITTPSALQCAHVILKFEEATIEKQVKRKYVIIQPTTMVANQNSNFRANENNQQANHQNHQGRG